MLEFPGGRGNGEIGAWESMLEIYVGNAGGVWEKERCMYSIAIVILVFIVFEKSKMTLKNRKAFDIIYKGNCMMKLYVMEVVLWQKNALK